MIIFDTATGKGIHIVHAIDFADAERQFNESSIEFLGISAGIYQITKLTK